MTTKTLSNRIINILISLIAIAVLGTISCSSSSMNPVGTGLDDTQEMTGNNLVSPTLDTQDREAQILWYENPEGSTEPNDTPEQAYQVYHAQLFNGHADASTDVNDYFKIRVQLVPASISVKLGWTDGSFNLYLYDEDLNPIEALNTAVGSPKEFFQYELEPGDYYVRVKCTWASGDYRIKFGIGRQVNEPSNDTIETTTWNAVDPESDIIRSVVSETEDQNDYFFVEVEEGEYVSAKLDWVGLSGTNLNVYLYNADYSPIVYSNGSAWPEAFASEVLSAGTYYIRVKAFAGQAIYELEVSAREPLVWDPGKFYYEQVSPWNPPDPPDYGFDPSKYENPLQDIPPQWNPFGPGPGDPFFNNQDDVQVDMPNLPQFGY